jgi:ribosomal protein L23
MGNDGTLRTAVKAVYAVSVATVKEGIEPPKKKAYRPRPGDVAASQGFTEVEDDPDLPF